jgi:tRNA(adenine34) deaminase
VNLLQDQRFNHQVDITKGVEEEACGRLLSEFFKEIRQRKKKK